MLTHLVPVLVDDCTVAPIISGKDLGGDTDDARETTMVPAVVTTPPVAVACGRGVPKRGEGAQLRANC